MFMWMLHNEMIMEKCLCECYIMKWEWKNVYVNVTQLNDNGEMFMLMLHKMRW
jgi:hypothetical protein